MTRSKSLLIGIFIFLFGALGYLVFRIIGFERFSAGIAAETILVVLIIGWIATYLLRVMTGNMTFMEQRRRYRAAYAGLAGEKLQSRFEAMSDSEQEILLRDLNQSFSAPTVFN